MNISENHNIITIDDSEIYVGIQRGSHVNNTKVEKIFGTQINPLWNCLVSKTLLRAFCCCYSFDGYSSSGITPPPRWTCLLCAFGLFVHQSADSIDEKRARRTYLRRYCVCAIGLFNCSYRQTYVAGTLRFGKIDVTEAQVTIFGIHLILTVLATEIYLVRIGFDILLVVQYAKVINNERCGKKRIHNDWQQRFIASPNLVIIPYPPRTVVSQVTGMNTNATSIRSSSDKNGATHHRRGSR
uniref:Uncharacterized protein n=1 Tax=Glossina morsitans morsitans TaxID=37546 RepID=A0A1B0GAK2_GLOMM